VRFIDNEYLEFYIRGLGTEKCKYRIQDGHPTGNISFEFLNQTVELTYNTQYETLYRVNGLNNYVNFEKR